MEFQQGADVVNSKIIGTKRAGLSWVIQANFPGMRNPNFELLYRPSKKFGMKQSLLNKIFSAM